MILDPRWLRARMKYVCKVILGFIVSIPIRLSSGTEAAFRCTVDGIAEEAFDSIFKSEKMATMFGLEPFELKLSTEWPRNLRG